MLRLYNGSNLFFEYERLAQDTCYHKHEPPHQIMLEWLPSDMLQCIKLKSSKILHNLATPNVGKQSSFPSTGEKSPRNWIFNN